MAELATALTQRKLEKPSAETTAGSVEPTALDLYQMA